MTIYNKLYIGGRWVEAESSQTIEVVNPATGDIVATVPAANEQDVNAAVKAAKEAFPSWSATTAAERAKVIHNICDKMEARKQEFIDGIVNTMGCPVALVDDLQVQGAIDSFRSFASLAANVEQQTQHDTFVEVREAIGVCVLINPWNYPLSQLVGKLGPALAAGCTVVLKPAEQTPLQDFILADHCSRM